MDKPLRDLSQEEIAVFHRDGVVCARKIMPEKWVQRMATAIDDVTANPTAYGDMVSKRDDGFSGDVFLWQTEDDFRDFVFDSPAALIAQQILGQERINFFYDQLFVKQPGCHVATPWHQDVTFWPVSGNEICSIWMPLDPVDRASSGLEFVRGSQNWSERYKATTPDLNPYMMESDYLDTPDIEAKRDGFELLGWDMEPGDVLLFDSLVLHGSTGNYTTDRPRRAFASRFVGADVSFAPRHPSMPLFWEHGLEPGDRLSGPLFPQVLPLVDPACKRATGEPQAQDPDIASKVASGIGQYMRERASGR
jgi:ectoine hydroxylase-related dioxygenase (phytanoyl-CoA dioxygenase family)